MSKDERKGASTSNPDCNGRSTRGEVKTFKSSYAFLFGIQSLSLTSISICVLNVLRIRAIHQQSIDSEDSIQSFIQRFGMKVLQDGQRRSWNAGLTVAMATA